MGLFKGLKGEFIDIIQWLDDSTNTLVYRFERYDNEIKMGAKLTVREGQAAVFINEGQLADVFKPGMYTLATQNLPILSTLKGWKYGFDSPFKAEVYFISIRNITDQKWGTKNPIILNDNRFGMIEIRAFGTYVLKVKDPAVFIREIVGTDGHFTADKISEQLRSVIVTRFTDAIGEINPPVELFAANLNELSSKVQEIMQPDYSAYGLDMTKFLIENVSMPEEIKKEIFELSRLNVIDLNKLTQMKAAKAMEKAAENQGGTAGAGMGMGMGFAMANQMGNAMSQQNNATPPPVPGAMAIFIAVDGKQTGPFDENALKQMITQNQLTKDSLVWKTGMSGWVKASELAELTKLFSNVPPPIPTV
jgi:membrane protease subunit (stomatin/prohibitin family)